MMSFEDVQKFMNIIITLGLLIVQGGKQGRRHTPSPTPARQGKRSPSPPPPVKQSGRHTPVGQRRSPSPTSKPPPVRRTPSPSPRASPHLRKRSPSPKMMRSMSDDSNVADSLKSEIADEYDLGVNSKLLLYSS